MEAIGYRLRTLGAVSLEASNGSALNGFTAQRKAIALLVLLARAGAVGLSRDKILPLLWPESDTDQARSALANLLFRVRRALGADAVAGTADLRLDSAIVASDVADFQHAVKADDLERAAALYSGPVLDGFYVRDAPEFERWAADERARLASAHQEVLERLALRASVDKDPRSAVTWWRRRTEAEPLNTRVARAYAEALIAAGEREVALAFIAAHSALVRSELDATPDPALAQLADQLRTAPVQSTKRDHVRADGFLRTSVLESTVPESPAFAAPAAPHAEPRAGGTKLRPFGVATAVVALLAVGLLALRGRPTGGKPGLLRQSSSLAPAPAAVAVDSPHAEPPSRSAASTSSNVAGARLAATKARLGNGRVLVVALQNETGDTTLSKVGAYAADWIAQGIQETGMVTVVDPLTTLALMHGVAGDTGATASGLPRAALIARNASADVVVWGSVYRHADSLLFQASISDVRSGILLAAVKPISSPLADPTSGAARLRSRVAGSVATLADAAFASVESPSLAPTFEAYGEYMAGLAMFQQFKTREAVRHFAAASALDTSFVTALVWSALVLDQDGDVHGRDSVVALLAARHGGGVMKGYALDYFQAEQRHDPDAVLIAARGAARLMPGSIWSVYAGLAALSQNRLRDAMASFAEVDPEHGWAQTWPLYWEAYMTTAHVSGAFTTEASLARRGLAIGVAKAGSRGHLVSAAIGMHRIAEAKAALEDAVRSTGATRPAPNVVQGVVGLSFLGAAAEFRTHGFAKEAAEMLDRGIRWFSSSEADEYVHAYTRDTARVRAQMRVYLGGALYGAGRYDESFNVFASLDSLYPEESRTYRGLIAARRGERQTAEAFLTSLDSLSGNPYTRALAQGRILCVLGDVDRAMRKLAFAVTGMRRAFSEMHGNRDWDAARINISYDPERRFVVRSSPTRAP